MLGADLTKVQHAIVYNTIELLQAEEMPPDMWAVIIDAAACKVKDYALADISLKTLDWRQKALESAGGDADDSQDDGR